MKTLLILLLPFWINNHDVAVKAFKAVDGQVYYKQVLSDTLSPETLYRALEILDIRFKRVVLAQALLESDLLNYQPAKERNNLFGMMVSRGRQTTAINKSDTGLAIYADIMDCLIDMKLYQQQKSVKRIKRENAYLKYLGRNYASSPDYVEKLEQILADCVWER